MKIKCHNTTYLPFVIVLIIINNSIGQWDRSGKRSNMFFNDSSHLDSVNKSIKDISNKKYGYCIQGSIGLGSMMIINAGFKINKNNKSVSIIIENGFRESFLVSPDESNLTGALLMGNTIKNDNLIQIDVLIGIGCSKIVKKGKLIEIDIIRKHEELEYTTFSIPILFDVNLVKLENVGISLIFTGNINIYNSYFGSLISLKIGKIK